MREGNVGHTFFIPIPHFTPSVPKRAIHAYKIAPRLFFQRCLEFLPSHRVRPDDVELALQFSVKVVVPSYVIAEV
jgi:hypothetical protein